MADFLSRSQSANCPAFSSIGRQVAICAASQARWAAGAAQRGRQPRDGVRRRAPRRVQAVPDRHLQAGQPGLGGGRQVGQHVQALRRGDGVGDDRPAADRGHRGGRLVAQQVGGALGEVLQRGAGTLVGHRDQVDLQHAAHQQPAQVRRGADAGVGDLQAGLVGAHVRGELARRADAEIAARQQHHRRVDHQPQRLEVAQRLVLEVAEQRGGGGHADVVQHQRVPVARRAGEQAGRARAAEPGDVGDLDRLPEFGGQPRGQRAGDGVGRPARRERHDQRQRPRRERRLGLRAAGDRPCERERSEAREGGSATGGRGDPGHGGRKRRGRREVRAGGHGWVPCSPHGARLALHPTARSST
jgi:hypothetical protein